ncbi:hypothetical protein [Hoylesella timonensis]|uniref:hypothetical protein n=1 Tax=Hoylesella timonensis TaxID=386414 RepID=UPI00288C1088|nr:hypothetical protein [Hoylesella timonensis]
MKLLRRRPSSAKIVQAEDKENLFALLRRSLSSAKIVQAEDKGNLFALLRRSLSSAKIVQAEDKGNLFALLRRSLSSAKIIILFEYSQFLRRKVCSFLYFNRQVTLPILSYMFPVLSVSVPLMDSCTIQISNRGSQCSQDSDCELKNQ